ncbi:unnamed protein product, partial [Gulo gulo]
AGRAGAHRAHSGRQSSQGDRSSCQSPGHTLLPARTGTRGHSQDRSGPVDSLPGGKRMVASPASSPSLCHVSPETGWAAGTSPASAHPGISPPRSSAGGQASSAVPPAQPISQTRGKSPRLREGCCPWQDAQLASVCRGPQALQGVERRKQLASRDTGVIRTLSTLAQPGAKHSGRIRKTDGQGAILSPGWLGPAPPKRREQPHPPSPATHAGCSSPPGSRQGRGRPRWLRHRRPHGDTHSAPHSQVQTAPGGTLQGQGQVPGAGPGALASHPQPWDEQPLPRTAQRALLSTALPRGAGWAGWGAGGRGQSWPCVEVSGAARGPC